MRGADEDRAACRGAFVLITSGLSALISTFEISTELTQYFILNLDYTLWDPEI